MNLHPETSALANLEPSQAGQRGSLSVTDCSAPGAAVLDACCGSRMFWFDRADPRAIYIDKRRETHELPDKSSKGGKRSLVVAPDVVGDFTALPFADESFALVVFDPPHFVRNGAKGWIGLKYGTLKGDWRDEQILALTPERPLVGNRCGKNAQSHWIVFLKQNRSA